MLLFLYSSVIVSNPLLRGRQWDAVADAVVSDMLDLYVSELAIDEAVARYRDAAGLRERAATKTFGAPVSEPAMTHRPIRHR